MDETMVREIVIVTVPDSNSVPDKPARFHFHLVVWTAVAQFKSLTIVGEE